MNEDEKGAIRVMIEEALARCNGGQVDGTPTRRRPSWGNILTLISMIGVVVLFWSSVAAEQATQNTRLSQLERQQEEEKKRTDADSAERRNDLKQINANVQTLLISVEKIKTKLEIEDRDAGRSIRYPASGTGLRRGQ